MTPTSGEPSESKDLKKCDSWLSQGDIFSSLPHYRLDYISDSQFKFPSLAEGPSLLISHDCALDKRSRKDRLVIEQLNFLPIQSLATFPPDQQAQIRLTRDQLAPLETLFLGEIEGVGEAFVKLSTPTRIPATYFGLVTVEGTDGSKDLRACCSRNDSRIGRLLDTQVVLFRRKWVSHWTGYRIGTVQNE